MPKVETNIEINAPSKKIWEVLKNREFTLKWDITTKEVTELGSDKYSVKSTSGDYIATITDQIENERVSLEVEHPDFNGYGYILKEKGDMTELSYWVDYEIVKHEKILKRGLKIILNGLKNFVEYLEDGGDPNEYDSKQILVKP